jgi:hypothetical protein
LLLTSAEAVSAIAKFVAIDVADAVVVGQLKLSSYFLSFDGLHVNGTIVATEILYGDGHAGQEFAYHLVVPCSMWDAISGVCSYRGVWQHWSEMKEIITQKHIFALVKGPGASWTAGDPKLAFVYKFTDREKAIAVLKEQATRARSPEAIARCLGAHGRRAPNLRPVLSRVPDAQNQHVILDDFVHGDIGPGCEDELAGIFDQSNAPAPGRCTEHRDSLVDGLRDTPRGSGVIFADILDDASKIVGGRSRPANAHYSRII